MKKALKIIAIILLLVVGAAAVVPIIFKDEIVAIAKEEANKNLNAELGFGDFSLSLFSHFPDFTFSIEDVFIVGKDEFEGVRLAEVGELAFTLDLMSVLKGEQIEVKEVYLNNTTADVRVLENGKANYDIVKASTDAAEPSEAGSEDDADKNSGEDFKINLQHYEVQNLTLYYSDATLDMETQVTRLNHQGDGDFTLSETALNTQTTIDELTFTFEGISYLLNTAVNLDATLLMNLDDMRFTFKENRLALNQLLMGIDGWFAMPGDDMEMDIKLTASETKLRGLMSMVPAVFKEGFEELKISGDFGLEAYVKGTMNDSLMPGFGANMKINEGRILYPDLPKSIDNIRVNASVVSTGGMSLDNTIIEVPVAHMEIAENPIDLTFNLSNPMTDPLIKLGVKAEMMLAEFKEAIPLGENEDISGYIKSDLKLSGRMSAIETENYEAFNASGGLIVRDFSYQTPDMPLTVINKASLKFNPQSLTLEEFDCVYGKTDVQANGQLTNYLAYALNDEVLKGNLSIRSNKIDVNEFMEDTDETTKETATTIDTADGNESASMSVVEIPENIDFIMDARINQILYDQLVITDANGEIKIHDRQMDLSNLSMNMLGGEVVMEGFYNTQNPTAPKIDFAFGINELDINRTVSTFNTVEKMAPIAKSCEGRFSADFSMTGELDEHMEPVLESLFGNGGLSTQAVSINNFKPLTRLSKVLKNESLENPTLKNINVNFKFVNGRVYVDPFDVNFEDINATISGNSGFDKTIDYTMNMLIPRDKLGGEANDLVEGLVSQANSLGANFSLGETVKLNVFITNTIDDPKIKTGLGEGTGKGAKDVLKDTFNQKKKEAEEKAREEIEKARKKAEEELKRKKEEAQRKLEEEKKRLEEEAKKKLEEERKKKEEEAKKKGKEALKDLFGKP